MLKLDILIPAILIVCLIALAYILHEIFNEPKVVRPDQTEIVLDPSRYTDNSTPTNGSSANVSNTPDALDNGGSITDNTTTNNASMETTTAANDEDQFADGTEEGDDGYESPGYNSTPTTPTTDYVSESERNASSNTSPVAVPSGSKYIVIAGSYRQEVNARQQMKRLRNAGFPDAEIGFTNRGAYAVAVAGKSDSEMNAREIAAKVRAKGYDAFVKQRRR